MRLSAQVSFLIFLILATFVAGASGANTTHESQPKACRTVIRACQKGGFVPGKANRHPGQGLYSTCVRSLAKGHVVKGVLGVSKSAAQACLKARRAARTGKS